MANESAVLRKVMGSLTLRSMIQKDTLYIRMDKSSIGMPDIIACISGRFFGIEVKDDANGKYKLTEAQKMRGKAIESAGGVFIVVDKNTVVDLNETIDDWLRVKEN